MHEYEYKILGETADKQKKISYWEAAIGLQMVDDLHPTEYLIGLAQASVDGELSYAQVEEQLYSHYENETEEDKQKRVKEGDLVAARIASVLDSPGYPLKPPSLMAIHKKLFQDIYNHAGQFRTVNIYKSETILGGRSVNYTNHDALAGTLEYDFSREKEQTYAGLDMEQIIKRISGFTSSIWQTHPFMEGNTRTTAVFMECYLRHLGFVVDNDMFKECSKYFRNSLVRANFADYAKGIVETDEFLVRFYRNLLTEDKATLNNRDLMLDTGDVK